MWNILLFTILVLLCGYSAWLVGINIRMLRGGHKHTNSTH